MIIQLFDYSVGMTLFEKLLALCTLYSDRKTSLKLKIVNEVMYLCCKNSILEKTEVALRVYLAP